MAVICENKRLEPEMWGIWRKLGEYAVKVSICSVGSQPLRMDSMNSHENVEYR